MLWLYLSVAFGGALGSVSRFALSGLVLSRLGHAMPWGTLCVNVIGSLVIGILFYAVSPEGRFELSMNTRQLFIAGFCGGFTTFSTFSLELLGQLREGDVNKALIYALVSVFACLLAVWLGFLFAANLNRQV